MHQEYAVHPFVGIVAMPFFYQVPLEVIKDVQVKSRSEIYKDEKHDKTGEEKGNPPFVNQFGKQEIVHDCPTYQHW